MKKALKFFLLFMMVAALAVAAPGCGGNKGAPAPAPADKKNDPAPAAKKKVVLASDTTYAPFESQDPETGKYVGFDIDLVNAIAEVANLDIEIRSMNFDGIIPLLETGSVDGAISAIAITDKNKQKVDFTVPYYLSGQIIAVKADNKFIKGWEDLKGRKLGVQISTTGAEEAHTILNAKVINYNTINKAFAALKSGDVEAVVSHYPVSAHFVKQNNDKDVKIVGDLRNSEHYGIAFPKKNTDLLGAFNSALKTLKENGKYAEIHNKWFGADPPAYLPGEPL